jgi:hypothetical protein
MPASQTEICNMAISHLGGSREIGDFTTDQSAEASACRRFWDVCRDKVLRSYPWGFAKKTATLALVALNPTDEWSYSYQYPSDCVMFRRIQSGTRLDSRQTRIPCEIVRGPAGKLILTDQANAVADYTERITETGYWESDFVLSFSLLLASYIAPRVTGGDPHGMGKRAMQMWGMETSTAEADASNEQQPEEDPGSEFERARA